VKDTDADPLPAVAVPIVGVVGFDPPDEDDPRIGMRLLLKDI
jgi:hypothetical protein